jgi:hypothetical protein
VSRRRALFRRQQPWELASNEAHPPELIAAAQEHLAFLEREYDFERDDELVGVDEAERHPDIGVTDNLVLAYRRGPEILKLSRGVLPAECEAVFLEWFPIALPEASYLYTGLIEGEATREAYDHELRRMADDLRRSLEIAARHWKERDDE